MQIKICLFMLYIYITFNEVLRKLLSYPFLHTEICIWVLVLCVNVFKFGTKLKIERERERKEREIRVRHSSHSKNGVKTFITVDVTG